MSFGYNASAAFGNTTATITDHAKGLLACLIDKREEEDVSYELEMYIRLVLTYPGKKPANHICGTFFGWHCN
jgi:hypothetical protein